MKRIVWTALFTACVFALTGGVYAWLVDARLDDLDRSLREVSDLDGGGSTIGIVGRLNLIQQRIRFGEDRVESYEQEARLQSMISGGSIGDATARVEEHPRTIAGAVLAFARFVVVGDDDDGGRPVEAASLSALEDAYLWERSRRYPKAVEKYERLLAERLAFPPAVRDRIGLHRAFCLAMNGAFDEALSVCTRLAEPPVREETASVALRMAELLRGIRERQGEVARTEIAAVDLGRELYLAMDYRGAREVLMSFIDKRTGDPRSPEAHYFLARTIEELGSSAIEEYRRVMLLDPDGPWGRDANRRLVMLGAFYGGDKEAGDSAGRRLARLGDTAFAGAVQPYRELVDPDPELARLVQESAPRGVERGELFVVTTPPGAHVIVNGVEFGISPVFVRDLPFGRNLIRAVTGRYTGERVVTVDRTDIVEVSLALSAGMGSIRVEPPFRISKLDGSPAGEADLQAVAPGRHVVWVEAPGPSATAQSWQKEVEVKAGETALVSVP
jgi:tetratricopeptide (TPR) repeat protein